MKSKCFILLFLFISNYLLQAQTPAASVSNPYPTLSPPWFVDGNHYNDGDSKSTNMFTFTVNVYGSNASLGGIPNIGRITVGAHYALPPGGTIFNPVHLGLTIPGSTISMDCIEAAVLTKDAEQLIVIYLGTETASSLPVRESYIAIFDVNHPFFTGLPISFDFVSNELIGSHADIIDMEADDDGHVYFSYLQNNIIQIAHRNIGATFFTFMNTGIEFSGAADYKFSMSFSNNLNTPNMNFIYLALCDVNKDLFVYSFAHNIGSIPVFSSMENIGTTRLLNSTSANISSINNDQNLNRIRTFDIASPIKNSSGIANNYVLAYVTTKFDHVYTYSPLTPTGTSQKCSIPGTS